MADRDITPTAAVGRDTEQTKRSSSAASVGISFGVGGPQSGFAVNLAASRSNAWSNGWGTTFWNSELTAGKLLSVDAGRDWGLSGAKATGETVLARVGSKGAGNLSIVSPQDESFYLAKEQSYGFNASIPWPGNPYGTLSLGVNASGLKLLAENESVKQQSSIVAGTGGYDVRVNGHTHLKGSTIASKADGWRNYFETQTLTHEDVTNRDVVSGAGWSVAVNISAGSSGAGAMAGSSVGFARMDSNETFTTRSSVASAVTLTRPDLQTSRVAALKASERDPLVAARNQRQRDLNILMINEPPPCDTCAYLSLPPGMDAVGALSAVASPPAAGKTAALSTSAAAQTDRSLPPPEAIDAGNSRYLAWLAAVKATRRDIDALNTRISAVDAKVYQTTASLSTSPSGLHQPLLYTFDKTKATQELRDGVAVTAAFGKAAYKAAGNYAGDKYKAAVNACGGNTNCPDAENWKDGGPYRAALHMAIGSMSFGAPGALGAGAGQAVLNVMDAAFFARLGITDPTAINLLKSAAVTMAGAAAGSTGGAAAAFNADANNRQLHPNEKERIKALAGADVERAKNLAAAACYLVRCSAEFAPGTVEFLVATQLERTGASRIDEIALLKQQLDPTGPMFGYTYWDRTKDSFSYANNRFGVLRNGGALGQVIVGGAGAGVGATMTAIGSAGCAPTAGGGCVIAVLGGAFTLYSLDQLKTGILTIGSQSQQHTLGATLIAEMTGISPDAAELWYAIPGVTTGAIGAAAANARTKAGAIEFSANSPVGLNPQNRALFERYKDQILMSMDKPVIIDASLAREVNELFREGATIGNGSTAAAVRFELATGQRVGDKLHSIKAEQSINFLGKWLNQNSNAAAADRAAAEQLIRDMSNALRGH